MVKKVRKALEELSMQDVFASKTISAATFSPDSRFLAVCANNIHIFDVGTGEPVAMCRPLPYASSLAFSPDGTMLAVKNTAGKIAIVNPADGSLVKALPKRASEGPQIEWSPCGKYLVQCDWEGRLLVWDISAAKVTHEESHPGEMIAAVSRTLDGSKWAFLHDYPGMTERHDVSAIVRPWPFESGGMSLIPLPPRMDQIALSSDGRMLAKGGTRFIWVLGLADGIRIHRQPWELPEGACTADLAFSMDGSLLASVQKYCPNGDRVRFYRMSDASVAADIPISSPFHVVFSPDGKWVLCCGHKSTVLVPVAELESRYLPQAE